MEIITPVSTSYYGISLKSKRCIEMAVGKKVDTQPCVHSLQHHALLHITVVTLAVVNRYSRYHLRDGTCCCNKPTNPQNQS